MRSMRWPSTASPSASVGLDLATMMARKDKVVGENTRGIAFLFRKNKITSVTGAARLIDANRVEVAGRTLEAKRAIIIATGSDSTALPGVAIDETTILSSTGALALNERAAAACRGGRRLYRARDGLGVAPARRGSHGDRVPRPRHAGHGWRIERGAATHAHAAGLRLPPRREGGRGHARQERRHAWRRAGGRRRARDARGGCGAGVDRAPALYRRARSRRDRRRARQSRPHPRRCRLMPPPFPASTRSAT